MESYWHAKELVLINSLMNKFLIVTHAFPPFGGGGVQRISKFAKYLQKDGWASTVVCPGTNNDSWLDYERMEEVKDIDQIRIGYRNLKGDSLLLRAFRKLYPIDVYYQWARTVVKSLKKKNLSQYKVIFTSGPPHSVHLAGLLIAKHANIKWVADFRDHFTLGPEYRATGLKKWANRLFEKMIYAKADAVIVNTATNKEEVLAHFKNALPEKIFTIYNGFDYADLQKSGKNIGWKKGTVKHYLYLGGLRGDKIDGIFYQTIATAFNVSPSIRGEFVIHIVGDHSRKGGLIDQLGLSDCIDFSDPVAYNNVGDYLEAADGCLTWQTPRPRYKGTIAGKIFDYLGMKKPIFSLGQDDGEIAGILNKHHAGVSANPENIQKASLAFIDFHEKIKQSYFDYAGADPDFLNQYNRVEQSKQLASIFDDLIKK